MPPVPDAPVPEPSGAKPEDDKETALEVAARARFGLGRWDRPALYREAAEAATDTDLPFWLVLLLSGAIATLGLALDQAAVVIGAMLIAPLLGPLLGLSLALAIGDGRLALQTAATIALGTVGVIAVAALLTVLLPFQNVTPEILARTRPTTLDLAIAVASGLAGAVVTVSREKRLSASIPGVAIAVALIPPLGVAGFGIGAGMQGSLIYGSLLLYGANFGGIVLSGMLVFLLVGMHRPEVLEAARQWHREGERYGLAARIEESRLFRHVRVFDSAWARVGLVCTFVGAVAVPLSSSLEQFIRETRVERAVDGVAAALRNDGRAAVLSRDVALGDGRASARFRVATADWIGEDERRALERAASRDAREPIALSLNQLVASDENLDSLVAVAAAERGAPGPPPEATLARLQTQVGGVLARLALPDGVTALGAEVGVGAGAPHVEVTYAAPSALPAEAEAMLARQTANALGLDPAVVSARAVLLAERPLPADSAALAETAALFARYPALRLRLTADSAAVAEARARFVEAGVARERIADATGAPPRYRYALAPPATEAAR